MRVCGLRKDKCDKTTSLSRYTDFFDRPENGISDGVSDHAGKMKKCEGGTYIP